MIYERACIVCGCTNNRGCDEGCFWINGLGIDVNLCSACFDRFTDPSTVSVVAERIRQDAKWGQQNHEPALWLGILGEEFGELCQAVNETVFDNGAEERAKGGYANMRAEATQIAAVAIAFVEMLDRRYGEDSFTKRRDELIAERDNMLRAGISPTDEERAEWRKYGING
jgi:NTP pyrophosphatase (non-canonical NTP hydrolase)